MIWLAFKIGFAEALGFIVLLPACLLHAWTEPTAVSTKVLPAPINRIYVDEWKWSWLNAWYADVEDGVSGQQAIIYVDDKGTLGTYASTFPSWTPQWAIAYAWSAWRNGANNIKRPLRSDT